MIFAFFNKNFLERQSRSRTLFIILLFIQTSPNSSSCFGVDRSLREWAMCLRIILILWTLLMALSVPYLIEVMGLIGNITGTVLSFIWPAYFHLKLKGERMSEPQRRFNRFVIAMGITICVLGVYYSAAELRNAINQAAQMADEM